MFTNIKTAEDLANEQLERDYQAAKLVKQEALAALTITTSNGNTFDGNETARNNMLSTLQSASFIGATTTEWKMADNSKVVIAIPELQEALALAIQAVGSIVVGE